MTIHDPREIAWLGHPDPHRHDHPDAERILAQLDAGLTLAQLVAHLSPAEVERARGRPVRGIHHDPTTAKRPSDRAGAKHERQEEELFAS